MNHFLQATILGAAFGGAGGSLLFLGRFMVLLFRPAKPLRFYFDLWAACTTIGIPIGMFIGVVFIGLGNLICAVNGCP